MASDYTSSVSATQKFGNEVSAILNTILERCKKEKDSGCLFITLDDYYERVSYYTAYPKTLIQEVTGVIDSKEKQLNLDGHILLMVCIKFLLNRKVPPTLTSVYNIYKQNKECLSSLNNAEISTASNFCSQINSVKYELRKTTSEYLVLVENPEVTFERYHYLSKIIKCRNENKIIYYIDERCINASLSYNKPTTNRKSNEEEYTLFLLISSKGYEHGLFTTYASQQTYRKWIENIVIPLLKPSSTIVMTNNYLHGVEKKPITRYHTKTQMMHWLREKGVPYAADMCKAELYDLIEKCTIRTKVISVDRLLKAYGHEVLHLPSTFEEISPIEFMWKNVHNEEVLLNNSNVYIAKNKLYNYLTTLSDTIWQSFLEKSKKVEDEIFDLDKQIEADYDTICTFDDKYDLEGPCVCKFYDSLAAGDGLK